jgi:hypothetical protein
MELGYHKLQRLRGYGSRKLVQSLLGVSVVSKENVGKQFNAPRYIKSPRDRRRWEESATRRYVLKVGEGPKRVADPDGNGDTYIDRQPGFGCKFCPAKFHANDTLNTHHNLEHPDKRNPNNDPPE